jgi:hypothetical protein
MATKESRESYNQLSQRYLEFIDIRDAKTTATNYRYKVEQLRKQLGVGQFEPFTPTVCEKLIDEITDGKDCSKLSEPQKRLIRVANSMLEFSLTGNISYRTPTVKSPMPGKLGAEAEMHTIPDSEVNLRF